MIKIQEYLNKDDNDAYWNQLLEQHWKELNPQKKSIGIEYKESSLIKKCDKYLSETYTDNYIKIYANNSKTSAARHRNFFKYLKNRNFRNLKRIVCAKPNEFDLITTKIFTILNVNDLYTIIGNEVKQTSFGKLLSDKFLNYNGLRKSNYAINLYKSMGFEKCYCPYCNDNKISIVQNSTSTKHKLYFQLDHFYSKSKNPYFAVSFFNLIPSCSTCNSTEKGDKEFSISTHIHPYYESFNDIYRFKVPLKSILTAKVTEFVINNNQIKPNDLTINDLNIFHRYVHNVDKIEKLIKFYLNYCKKDPLELKEIIFEVLNVPETISDILKKENGKFLRDIAYQLDEKRNLLDL